jgi:hypothetical protein
MDPRHLVAFNTLVKRYAEKGFGEPSSSRIKTEVGASSNFAGLPFIDTYNGTNEMFWLAEKDELIDNGRKTLDSLMSSIGDSRSDQLKNLYTTTNPTGDAQ